MKHLNLMLPIFPLPVFLLPQGIARLRIFEPRYIKMIKRAIQGQGFVLWMQTKEEPFLELNWGSWVEIVDFGQGDDGILEVDVKCKALVEILSLDKDSNNAYFGQVIEISHWSQVLVNMPSHALSQSIADVFENTPQLNALYPEKHTDSLNWVIARWLELLPISLLVKNSFVETHNFEEAKDFVQSIIDK
ncbi:LON peptidase substrate-binding domain-containing protein [Colwellia sp. MSW7]|jgi:Lon protease-like protein|uniref:LON peptidase substrate-binding domain-containing protein n=1 Tax=Colwellia maritima TaxID=2912588 RepID=A0ABS9X6J9_9GAMM|nr:LON peptidase substrate-binding domain-containing protein [Colwellia maritima]MCI2285839.1 LON peptidase substrate-binding domain-containing protein [Colwellia maritima]